MERAYTEGFENSVLREIADILETDAKTITEWDFRFPRPCGWGLRSSAMLRGVSRLPIGPIFKSQAVPGECLNLEDRTIGLSRNVVTSCHHTPCNIPEERRHQLHSSMFQKLC